MSKNKYPNIFSKSNGGYCVILQIFFAVRAVFKIGKYSRGAFRPIASERKYLMTYNGW